MTEINKGGPWVYIAGPYTLPDPVENTHRAIKTADRLTELGFITIIPHVTLFWHIISPQPTQFWYDYTAELLKRCDLVYRLRGASKGGDQEVEKAIEINIPVIFEGPGDKELLLAFMKSWQTGKNKCSA